MTRILCVEDSDDNLYMLHRRLSRAGFDVKVSSNGAEGVEWAKTLKPDLIVMDLNLPGMDGLQLTRWMKDDATTRDIPILAVTAYALDGDADIARDAGCSGYVAKPYDPAVLVQEAKRLLNETRTDP